MSRTLQRGDRLGSYTVIRKLDGGGNADVYVAASKEHDSVALKVLRNRRTTAEPYRRFRQEVIKHSELSERGDRGILPLFDFNVPGTPTDENPPWMTMPLAVPIEKALGDSPSLEAVVMAVAAIAETLARLHSESTAHRDVKPSNLYRHEDAWVISDFGLVYIPDGEPLTVGAKALGPRHFIAPEMILRPGDQDGRSADVYSLGKTLWCLVTGQRVPPPGEHRAELKEKSVRAWGVAHPRAFYLDRLVEQTSLEVPEDRPPMRVVADSLTAWATSKEETGAHYVADVKDISDEIAEILSLDRVVADRHQTRRDQANEVAQRFAECLDSLIKRLDDAQIPNSGIGTNHVGVSQSLTGFADSFNAVASAWRSVEIIRNTGRDQRGAFWRSGVAVALAMDQTLIIAAAHSINSAGGHETVWKGSSSLVLLGSAELDNAIIQLQEEFVEAIPMALKRFLSIIRG